MGITKKIQDRLETLGLPVPGKPAGVIPELPEDVTNLDDEGLMVLYTDFTVWADYAATQLALAYVEERGTAKRLELEKAENLLLSEKGTVTAAKAAAEVETAAFADDAEHKYAYRKVLESVANNLERDAALLSRELSRRLGERTSGQTRRRNWSA